MINWLDIKGTVLLGALVASSAWGVWQWSEKKIAQGALVELEKKELAEEKRELEEINKILLAYRAEMVNADEQHSKELEDAERKYDALVDGLQRGDIKLRKHWTCPTTPSGQPDEETRLREKDSGHLVRIGAEADSQVSGLQRIVEEQRKIIEDLIDGKEAD